jgi:hypothetical protein
VKNGTGNKPVSERLNKPTAKVESKKEPIKKETVKEEGKKSQPTTNHVTVRAGTGNKPANEKRDKPSENVEPKKEPIKKQPVKEEGKKSRPTTTPISVRTGNKPDNITNNTKKIADLEKTSRKPPADITSEKGGEKHAEVKAEVDNLSGTTNNSKTVLVNLYRHR